MKILLQHILLFNQRLIEISHKELLFIGSAIDVFQGPSRVTVEIHLLDTNDNSPAFLPSKHL